MRLRALVAFHRFCIWQMQWERRIGNSTGMNPEHLHHLSREIMEHDGELQRLNLNLGRPIQIILR